MSSTTYNKLYSYGTPSSMVPSMVNGAGTMPSGTCLSDYLYWGSTGSTVSPSGWVNGGDNIRLGKNAGAYNQKTPSVAIGFNAGYTGQGSMTGHCIAIGVNSGYTTQRDYAIAIGSSAGATSQKTHAISVGAFAGSSSQSTGGIAIGYQAAQLGQSQYSIAIGYQAASAQSPQPTNSIVLNSSGSTLNAVSGGLVVSNLNQYAATNLMYYNPSSKEIYYDGSTIKIKKDVVNFTKDTSTLLNLQPREFFYKSDIDNSEKCIGFIAEEVDLVDPNFAVKDVNGEPANIYWNTLTVYLIEEVKKLRILVDELKVRGAPPTTLP